MKIFQLLLRPIVKHHFGLKRTGYGRPYITFGDVSNAGADAALEMEYSCCPFSYSVDGEATDVLMLMQSVSPPISCSALRCLVATSTN